MSRISQDISDSRTPVTVGETTHPAVASQQTSETVGIVRVDLDVHGPHPAGPPVHTSTVQPVTGCLDVAHQAGVPPVGLVLVHASR